jgi:hypothetical protein
MASTLDAVLLLDRQIDGHRGGANVRDPGLIAQPDPIYGRPLGLIPGGRSSPA